jgi:DNA topoisomerase II
MPLWSLTQERVDKLLRQIGDKETEIDTLIKLSKEDLWKRDLDDFIAEWRFQLEDEDKRQRAITKVTKGRRTSKKFATAATFKKRKGLGDDSGDEDFEIAKPSKKQTKITAFQAPRSTLVEDHPKTNAFAGLSKMMRKSSTDGASDDPDVLAHDEDDDLLEKPKPATKTKAPKPATSGNDDIKPKSMTAARTKENDTKARPKPKAVKADSDVEEVASRPAPRQARAATKKPINYGTDSDSDNGDDLLGDVSNMVKGLPTNNGDSRSFFSSSISRPGSSAGYKTASRAPSKMIEDLSDDETDYTKLVPQQSPRRSILVTAKENNITEDEDEILDRPSAPSRQQTKAVPPAPKPTKVTAGTAKAKPPAKTTKKPALSAQPKKNPQSPVAKAYAKRLAKKRVVDSDDDINAMADDILDSPGNEEVGREASPPARKAGARPMRRAATTAKKASYAFDDDDDDDDESEDVQSDEEPSAMFSDSE